MALTIQDAVTPLTVYGQDLLANGGRVSVAGAAYDVGGPANLTSKRRPWPHDMVISGHPVVLRPQEDGLLIGRKLETLRGVAPITYDYGSAPVYAERTFPFRRILGGYGERVQQAPTPSRYYYAINADLSIGGLQIKGPRFAVATPPLTGAVRWFLDAVDTVGTKPPDYPPNWPLLATFAGAGRYVLKRVGDDDDDWTVSKDFGDGNDPKKAVRFRPTGGGQVDAMWVVTQMGELWKFDGAAWTKSAVPNAYTIAVLRDELWIADNLNNIRKAEADPLAEANWAAAIPIGDASQPITNLEAMDNDLFIFKSNGIFTVAPDASSRDLFPSLRQQPMPRNGVNAASWLGRLWFGYGDGYYWLDRTLTLTPVGPNNLVENNSEVAGEVLCFTGHASWFGYYGLWNGGPTFAGGGPGNSYLVKHGTWINPEQETRDNYRFLEVPNGALKKWTGKKISALYVSDAAQGNARLYCGFENGSVEWCRLPRGTPNPVHPDSGCEFTEEATHVYWPLHHAMFQADLKAYHGASVFGPSLTVTNFVRVQYRVSPGFGELPPVEQRAWIELGQDFTFPGQRVQFPPTVFGAAIEVRHELLSTVSNTPVIEGVALHEQIRPAFQLEWTWTVNARHHLARRDGVVTRQTPMDTREACAMAAASVPPVEMLMPDEGYQMVSVIDYSEALAVVNKRYGPEWDIAMRGIQFRTVTAYGNWDRLAVYDWDVLASHYTWDDVLYL